MLRAVSRQRPAATLLLLSVASGRIVPNAVVVVRKNEEYFNVPNGAMASLDKELEHRHMIV